MPNENPIEIVYKRTGYEETKREIQELGRIAGRSGRDTESAFDEVDRVLKRTKQTAEDEANGFERIHRRKKRLITDTTDSMVSLMRAEARAYSAMGDHARAAETLSAALGKVTRGTREYYQIQAQQAHAARRAGSPGGSGLFQTMLAAGGVIGAGALGGNMSAYSRGIMQDYGGYSDSMAAIGINIGDKKNELMPQIEKAVSNLRKQGFKAEDLLPAFETLSSTSEINPEDLIAIVSMSGRLARANKGTSFSDATDLMLRLKAGFGMDAGRTASVSDLLTMFQQQGTMTVAQASQFLPRVISPFKALGGNERELLSITAGVSGKAPAEQIATAIQNVATKLFKVTSDTEKFAKANNITVGLGAQEIIKKQGILGYMEYLGKARTRVGAAKFDQQFIKDMEASQGLSIVLQNMPQIRKIYDMNAKGMTEAAAGAMEKSAGHQQRVMEGYVENLNTALGASLTNTALPVNQMKIAALAFMTEMVKEHQSAAAAVMGGIYAGGELLDKGSQAAMIAMAVKTLAPKMTEVLGKILVGSTLAGFAALLTYGTYKIGKKAIENDHFGKWWRGEYEKEDEEARREGVWFKPRAGMHFSNLFSDESDSESKKPTPGLSEGKTAINMSVNVDVNNGSYLTQPLFTNRFIDEVAEKTKQKVSDSLKVELKKYPNLKVK